MHRALPLLLLGLVGASADTIPSGVQMPLVTFDGAKDTTFSFKQLNDPVMGGKSKGTFTLNKNFGSMDGEVVDVPSLKAPGFIKASADGKFKDVSAATAGGLKLRLRSSTPSYTGFRVSFASGTVSPTYACSGGGQIPFSRGCYKAKFNVPAGSNFTDVYIPFNQFSDKWSPSTGEQTTTCAQDADVCPTAAKLAGIKRVEVWAEGVDGKIEIDVESITAVADVPAVQAIPSGVQMPLVTFDGAKDTTFSFKQLNDPVMGGKSKGTFTLNKNFGSMDGEVVDVPSLKAPGFIKASADGKFKDVSAATAGGLKLRLRSSTPSYTGFRVSFASGTVSPTYACSGGGSIPFSRGCFKAKFNVPAGEDFQDVYIPFNQFSDKWSPSTGEQTTTCAQDADVCPTAAKLAGIKRVEVWAEGVDGKIEIDVESITAVADVPVVFAAAAPSEVVVPLVTFDGAAGTTHTFKQLNDPVMGGKSKGAFNVASDNGQSYGAMTGEVVDVPSLKAPGFITAASNDKFADASAAVAGGLRLRVRSPSADYTGFRVSFAAGAAAPEYSCAGGGSIPFSRGCFKAKFNVPAGSNFTDVYIPFNQFSDKWSPSTGEQTTTCAQDADVCPTAAKLAGIQRMQVWAEGVNGKIELDVLRIDAVA